MREKLLLHSKESFSPDASLIFLKGRRSSRSQLRSQARALVVNSPPLEIKLSVHMLGLRTFTDNGFRPKEVSRSDIFMMRRSTGHQVCRVAAALSAGWSSLAGTSNDILSSSSLVWQVDYLCSTSHACSQPQPFAVLQCETVQDVPLHQSCQIGVASPSTLFRWREPQYPTHLWSYRQMSWL